MQIYAHYDCPFSVCEKFQWLLLYAGGPAAKAFPWYVSQSLVRSVRERNCSPERFYLAAKWAVAKERRGGSLYSYVRMVVRYTTSNGMRIEKSIPLVTKQVENLNEKKVYRLTKTWVIEIWVER